MAASVPIVGLLGGGEDRDSPCVRVELDLDGSACQDDGAWTELLRRTAPDGTLHASIHHDPAQGYRVFFAGYGRYDLAADGSSVVCRPPPGLEAWQWQQFLFGQALPFAAVLNGLEPFHASGVVIEGRVVAFAGGTGAGKSSIALQLAALGARFFTDDVLAVSCHGSETLCHGGPGLANVRDRQLRDRAERGTPPFGGVLGTDVDSARAIIDTECGPLPLGALYFLERGRGHERVYFETSVDPYQLLGHTFNAVVRSPARLTRQLHTCAQLASTASIFRIKAPDRLPADQLAALIEAHALDLA